MGVADPIEEEYYNEDGNQSIRSKRRSNTKSKGGFSPGSKRSSHKKGSLSKSRFNDEYDNESESLAHQSSQSRRKGSKGMPVLMPSVMSNRQSESHMS